MTQQILPRLMSLQFVEFTTWPMVLIVLQHAIDFIDCGFRPRLVAWLSQFFAGVHPMGDHA